MSSISFFRRRKRGYELELPWNNGTAIFTHIQQNLSNDQAVITYTGNQLPDEYTRNENDAWTAGAHDSVSRLHNNEKNQKAIVSTIIGLLNNIATSDSQQAKVELYKLLRKCGVIEFIDGIADTLIESAINPKPNLHRFLRFIAKRSPDREPVKFSIALLGLIGSDSDLELISTLSRHEEFTLYGAAAINNMFEDPDEELWKLAIAVHGWGRIHLVEHLAQTLHQNIRDWLLREGYRNDIMHEYLAYTVAIAGDLNHALSHGFVDDELLLAASEIIEALFAGGPAEDINDYKDAAETILSYLRHLRTRHTNLKTNYFITTQYVQQYLAENLSIKIREGNGWTEEKITQARILCDEVLSDPQWPPLAEHLLLSSDEHEFTHANEIAYWLDIDTWDIHWNRLQLDPINSGCWMEIMRIVQEPQLAMVLEFGENNLPLGEIATQPADETGMGPEFEPHHCLDFILQELERFPHQGWSFIRTGLNSPVVRNRSMAISALKVWDADYFDVHMLNALDELQETETEPDLVQDIIEIMDKLDLE